jgi:hypothetical protein
MSQQVRTGSVRRGAFGPPGRRFRHAYGALVLVALAVAGCGGSRPAPHRDPAPADRVPVLLHSADLRLPLDDYYPSIAESQRLARAHRALLSQCVRGFGYHYTAPDPAQAGPRTWNERRYGLTDPTVAAADGYWASGRAEFASGGRPANHASAAENDLVTGAGPKTVNGKTVPAGGCAEEARRRLTASDPAGADQSLAQRLGSDTFFRSQRDPRVQTAFQQWSACMKAAGFTYAGPLDPPKDPRFQGGLGKREIAAATADVACKRQTNLVGVWFTVEASQQWSLIEANKPALQLARTAFQAELAIAAGVGT